jgi:hypothetical protein
MSQQLRLPFVALRKYHGGSQTAVKPRKKKKNKGKRRKRDVSALAESHAVYFEPLAPLESLRSQSVAREEPERDRESMSPDASPVPSQTVPLRKANTQLHDRIRFLETREEARRTLRGTLVGNTAKLEYIDSYSHLDKVREKAQFHHYEVSPIAEYLQQIDKNQLKPESMGLIRRKGKEEEIDVAMYGMGDRYADALSQGIKHIDCLSKLNVSGNRLTDFGASQLVRNLAADTVVAIDLSNNMITGKTVEQVCEALDDARCKLQMLGLEGNKLGDSAVHTLMRTLGYNETLLDLNLARNLLGDLSARSISTYLKDTKSLQKLDLHWNNIRGPGGCDLFRALSRNTSLRILDISWNALGNPQGCGAGDMISRTFKRHPALFHVDISHNKLLESDCVKISEGLSHNHGIMGLHMDGNETQVDVLGFMRPEKACRVPSTAHIFTRILGNSKVKNAFGWRECDNCWICERWSEVEFVWQPGLSGTEDTDPLYLHLHFEAYAPFLMDKREDGCFREFRMCPPGEVKYFFSPNCIPKLALGQETAELAVPISTEFVFYGNTAKPVNMKNVNMCVVEKAVDLLHIETKLHAVPRPAPKLYSPTVVTQKRIWGIPISIFKDYRFDNDHTFNQCFEFDWERTKIPKLVKDVAQQNEIRKMLRANYRLFREAYKHYSSLGQQAGVWSIGQNAFSDLCMQCNLVDGVTLKLSDLDFQFKVTNYSEVKNHPRNPANALIRFQFMEIFVRIAIDKYIKSEICESYAEAVDKMLKENLLPVFANYDTNKWRWGRYLNEECDNVFKAYLPIIQTVYKANSKKNVKPGQKPFMCLEEFQEICANAHLLTDSFTTREIDICFNLAMITQVNELDSDRHFQMSFVEFLEALGRAADLAKYPDPVIPGVEPKPANKDMLLYQSLENMMPRLLGLCPRYMQETFEYPESSPLRALRRGRGKAVS